jgi:hypothetical protein
VPTAGFPLPAEEKAGVEKSRRSVPERCEEEVEMKTLASWAWLRAVDGVLHPLRAGGRSAMEAGRKGKMLNGGSKQQAAEAQCWSDVGAGMAAAQAGGGCGSELGIRGEGESIELELVVAIF